MAIYTNRIFKARKDFGPIMTTETYELIVDEDRDYLLNPETGDVFEVRVDAYDNDVLFLSDNPKVKFDIEE